MNNIPEINQSYISRMIYLANIFDFQVIPDMELTFQAIPDPDRNSLPDQRQTYCRTGLFSIPFTEGRTVIS